MDRKEAIKILKDLADVDNSTPIPNKLFYEAFDMAIEALQKEIERQEVIKASERYLDIVRCKDCRWYEDLDRKIFENCVRGDRIIPTQPDDFCSHGERRE